LFSILFTGVDPDFFFLFQRFDLAPREMDSVFFLIVDTVHSYSGFPTEISSSSFLIAFYGSSRGDSRDSVSLNFELLSDPWPGFFSPSSGLELFSPRLSYRSLPEVTQ